MTSERTLPPAGATGVGSMPGVDIRDTTRQVFDLPDTLPFLPELPARGLGAEMIGRTAVALVGLPVDVAADGWRLTSRPGRDARRAAQFTERDLDTLTEVADGYTGWLKVALAGPWTMAAELRLTRGGRALADAGAVRDIAASLAEGAAAHVADIARRVPGARVVTQFDEPWLPAVLGGAVPTESGLSRLAAVEDARAREALATVLHAVPGPTVVHCCAQDVPFGLLHAAGADAVSFDAGLAATSTARVDALAETVDAGLAPWFGVLASTGTATPAVAATLGVLGEWERRLARPLPEYTVISPTCGLAGASAAYAAQALTHCAEVARRWFTLGER